LEDPAPLSTVPAGDLRLLMLEDDGKVRKITTKGVGWRARKYVGAWMTGQVGREVGLRYMPHHEHEVEVFDARTHEHLGAATLVAANVLLFLLFVPLLALVCLAWWLLNWMLSLAALFAVRDGCDAVGAISSAIGFSREHRGAVSAVTTWSELGHLVILSIASTAIHPAPA